MPRSFVASALALLSGAALLCAPASARAEHPDFSGTFKLDLAASDSLDDMLKAVGASWLERKAAGSVVVTQVVKHRGDVLEIEAKSSLRAKKNVIRIGAGWQEQETEMGKGRARTDWSPDGTALVTHAEAQKKGGPPLDFRTRRTLEDGGKTTVQALELRVDGKVYRARRILRRVER